jgi:hypothetical protein
VRKATWRKVNKRLVLSGDAPALEAAALALWGAAQKAESIYETRGLVTL